MNVQVGLEEERRKLSFSGPSSISSIDENKSETPKIKIETVTKPNSKRLSAPIGFEGGIKEKEESLSPKKTTPAVSGKTKSLIDRWEQSNQATDPVAQRKTLEIKSIPTIEDQVDTPTEMLSPFPVSHTPNSPPNSSSDNANVLSVGTPYNCEKKEIDLRTFLAPNLDPVSRQAIEKCNIHFTFI